MQDSNQIEQKGEDQLQSAKLEENIFNRSHSFPQHTSTQIGLFYNAINTTQNSAIPCKGGLFEKNQVSQDPFSQSGAGGLFHNSGGLFHNQGGLFDTNPASKDSIFQSTGRSFDKNQVSQETNSQKPSQQSEQNQEADKEEHKQEITQKNNESQEKEKKQYFSKNCPSHQGYNLQFLSVDQNSKKYLLCPLCISEGNGGQYIYLDLIFGNDKLIKNLPKEEQENSEFLKQMQYVLGEQDFSNQVKQKINDKFENLKKQIISQLDIKQKEMLKQAELLENYQNKIQQNYNNYIQKDKIKELLIKDQNINQVEQKLKSIIDGIYTRQKKFQQEVQQDMINYQTQISAINYDQVSDISKRILQQISAIEVFKISDLKSLSQTDYENNMSVYNEELFKTDPNKLTASQLLVRLLSNKMNNCPPSLLEQFKQLIAKIQGFIDTQGIKIPKNNNLFKVDYNKFDDSQIKLIQDLSESLFQDSNNSSSFQPKNNNKDILMGLISNKFNQCSKEFLEYISSQLDKINPFIKSLDLDNKGYQISGSKLNQAKLEQLIELVKDLERDDKKKFNQIEEFKKVLENETNNLSVEFINNYKLVSIQYPDILENLLLKQGIFQKSKSPIMDFNRLNNHQMTNLQNLAKKMNQLKDDFDSRYLNSKQPIHYQQIQSAHFVNQIKRCLNIKTLEQQLKLEQEQEIEDQNTKQKLERALEQLDIIQQLLVKYPIFDLREDLFVHKLYLKISVISKLLAIEMKLERPFIVWHGQYQRIVTLDVHPFINLLVTGGSDEEVYEGEDLEFEEEIGYIKLWQINENYTPGQGGDAKPVTFIRALKKHSNPVNCVRFSPNGQYLASASDDHKIVIWHVDKGFQNISTNQKIFNLVPKNILEGHNREVCDLRWFNDSTHLISGGMDYRAYIWNVKEGVIKQTIVGAHKSYVQGVAVDPKMKFCLTLGNDRTVKVWRKLKSNNKKKNIFEYIPSNTMKRLPFADVNIEEEMLSDDEDKSSITGNQMNGANGAVNQAMTYGMFLSERQLNTFVKRPDWSPDGSFFLLPAAIYQEKRDSKIEMCVYLYRRNVLNKPSLIINTNNKPAICTRFCQKLFKKKEENQFSMVDIPYVIIFAISTIDNVMIYSTASLSPLAVVGNIHFALINDLTFFSNQSLIICSSDGMCSFVFFEENDLGKPLNSEEIQDEEIRNIVNVESFYPNELLRALVYPSQTKQILKEYNENIKQQQKQQQQITDINSQKEEKNKEYVVEKFNFACMEEEEQIIPIKPQEIQFKTTSTGEKKKVIIPAVIKKY